jgi:hypothetical protein
MLNLHQFAVNYFEFASFLGRLSVIVIRYSVTRHVDILQHQLCGMDFSVDLLHTMEKEMKSDIQKILKSVNMSATCEVNEVILMRFTKTHWQNILKV